MSGNPKPRLTWNVRGKILRPGDSDDGGKYTVTPLGLVIVNVTQADKGAYKCKATQLDEDITDFQEMIIDLKVQRKIFLYFFFRKELLTWFIFQTSQFGKPASVVSSTASSPEHLI